ncbi:MAG: STAS domain-containing protein [Acidimicrobiia bacterium]
MPGTPFSAGAHNEGESTVIDLRGDIDRSAQDGLLHAYAETTGKGPVILNFTEVDYINSTGIAVIVGLLARARADGRPLKAFGLSDHYREIFQITRLADFMTIFANEPAALAGQGREN